MPREPTEAMKFAMMDAFVGARAPFAEETMAFAKTQTTVRAKEFTRGVANGYGMGAVAELVAVYRAALDSAPPSTSTRKDGSSPNPSPTIGDAALVDGRRVTITALPYASPYIGVSFEDGESAFVFADRVVRPSEGEQRG